MAKSKKLFVPMGKAKLDDLIEYGLTVPKFSKNSSRRKIAELLETDESTLSCLNNDGQKKGLSELQHRRLLNLFEIKWPCPSYYDETSHGHDKYNEDEKWFRWFLFPDEHPRLRLQHRIKYGDNRPPFADRELFVFKLEDTSADTSYSGSIITKPSRKTLIGQDEEFVGHLLGFYGLSEFNVTLEITNGAQITVDSLASLKSSDIEIRDRSSDTDYNWLVRNKTKNVTNGSYLDENINLAAIKIDRFGNNDTMTIKAYSALPLISLELPKEVAEKSNLSRDDLLTKMQKIAEGKIVERYREVAGGEPDRDGTLAIGSVEYELKKNAP